MSKFRTSQKTAAFCAFITITSAALISGCYADDRPISEIPFYQSAQSTTATPGKADKVMSGHYEVSPEGKLLRPKDITRSRLLSFLRWRRSTIKTELRLSRNTLLTFLITPGSVGIRPFCALSARNHAPGAHILLMRQTNELKQAVGLSMSIIVSSTSPLMKLLCTLDYGIRCCTSKRTKPNIYNGTELKSYSDQLARFRVQMRQFDGMWKITGAKRGRRVTVLPSSFLDTVLSVALLFALPFHSLSSNPEPAAESETVVTTTAATTPDGGVVETGITVRQTQQAPSHQNTDLVPGEVQAELGRRALPKNETWAAAAR